VIKLGRGGGDPLGLRPRFRGDVLHTATRASEASEDVYVLE